MKKLVIILLLSICQLSNAQIGTWRNYLAYYDIQQIQAAGNDIFVMASNDLYQYNKEDQSIRTYDKTNGLSDTYITHIRWCSQAKRLIAVYQNANIDVIDTNGNVTNISNLYNKLMTGDKTVSSIRIDGIYAYLICGFGIVKVNMKDALIADTYTPNHPEYPKSLPEEDNSDYDKYIDLVRTLKPGGPKYNHFYFMKYQDHTLYTCGGLYHPLINANRPGTVQTLQNNEWTIYQDQLETTTNHEYADIDCLDIDPANSNHVFAGGRTGLYEFLNGSFVKEYTIDNSELKSTFDDNKNYVIVNTAKFDKAGNLWMAQSLNIQNKILVFTKDGQWIKKAWNDIDYLGDAKNMYFDNNNYLWFVNNHGHVPALYRYNTNTDEMSAYTNFVNQDGTVVNINGDGGVRCVAEDLEGNMWIGTSSGPLMLEKSQINNTDYYFTQVKVPRNDGTNYADYLLANIDISCIAIDGAGRKWFGTMSNGVYLISSDNMTQIHHFTIENSKLLSNNIESITINQTSGEVFFGTDKGLCSFISEATKANDEMNEDNVWAYPNPVTPDYTGLITVTGLTLDADVKIVASNGALIAEGRSSGGSFTWDGNDQKGRRVASGVYMVVTATNTGQKGTVCKIAVVN